MCVCVSNGILDRLAPPGGTSEKPSQGIENNQHGQSVGSVFGRESVIGPKGVYVFVCVCVCVCVLEVDLSSIGVQ